MGLAGGTERSTIGLNGEFWIVLERILLVSVVRKSLLLRKGGTNLIWVDAQVYELGLLQVRVLISLLSSSREGKLELARPRLGQGWFCLVGPGPGEDVLLLDFDFLMS